MTVQTTKNNPSKFNFAMAEDTISQSKGSTGTNGGSLATRVALVISKILSSSKVCPSDDDVGELNSLISEVNFIDNLTLKHSTVSKILNLLCEKPGQSLADKVNQSKQLQFQSRLKLELKTMQVDPVVIT